MVELLFGEQKNWNISGPSPIVTSITSYGYDADGNQTSATTQQAGGGSSQTQYVYDPYSRLVSVEVPGVSRHEFTYDGLSRLRVSLFYTWNAGTNGWNAPVEKRRIYDGMDVVQERDAGNSVTASVTRAGNIGGVLARVTYASSTTSAGGASFYGYDLQGNVVTLTDGAGAVVGSYNYDAWGNVLNSLTPQAGENPYRFSTKEQLGRLVYFGFRFYNPGTGRWINRDPIRENGGINLYGFNHNNPIKYVDPNGQSPLLITGGIGATFGGVAGAYNAWRNNENILAGAGKGALVGGVTGLTGGAVGMATTAGFGAVFGGSAVATGVGGALGGAAGGAIGDIAGQRTEMALGMRCSYDPYRTAFAGTLGGVGGAFVWRPTNAPMQRVYHWGGNINPDSGKWVQLPSPFFTKKLTGINYPGAPTFADVPSSTLQYPPGLEGIVKGFFGQRVYVGPAL